MEPGEYALMDSVEDRMWWYRALHARMLAALVPVRGPILDVGCGTGGFLAKLGRARPELARFGVEFAALTARRAAEKSAASIARGSANALPFAAQKFAAVVAADVLCHAAVDPAAALKECFRVLAPGGRLVVNMPAFAWLASAHDRRVHNARRQTAAASYKNLAAAGFAAIETRYWNGLLLPLMIVQRKILARGDENASDVAVFPPWLDATLHAVTECERVLPFPLPAGGSILATAVRH